MSDRWRCLRLVLAALAIPVAAALTFWPSAAALECEGVALDDGCLFTITGGDTTDPDDGYAVTNADGVPLWDFVGDRDLQAIGYPISQRWVNGPFTLQAFQKVILQWDPGKGRMNYYNTLDVLANRYPDVDLPNVPPHQVLDADRGADFATITRNHLALLDQNAAIKERFLREPDWLNLYGLPISYEEREVNGHPRGLQMLRAQRTVFVIWNVPAPGTTVGRVNLQNVPDKVKRLSNVIIPDGAKVPVAQNEVAELPTFTLAPPPARPDPTPRHPPTSDREVLATLYHMTGGPSWKNSTNWLSAAPLGEWHGVTTDSTGQITALRLQENRLRGEIPPELGSLTNLRELRLSGNQLRGAIPPELSRLAKLTVLGLEGNRLVGEIPPVLGRLSKLDLLMLNANHFRGEIPPELGGISNLKWLDLSNSQLSGAIPPELGSLSNLLLLSLWGNQLHGAIPAELGSLSNLRSILLNGNQLSGSIPPALGNLSNLVGLGLGNNQLTGTIPTELGNLVQLESLILHWNQLRGEIPPELGRLAKLEALDLFENQLSGSIPPALGSLANLRRLRLEDNHLHGQIPPRLGHLVDLEELRLGGSNDLTGCIPEELGGVADSDLDTLGLPFCGAGGSSASGAAGPTPAESPTSTPAEDRAVLVALYHGTDGANWTRNHNWLSEAPLDAWYGVVTARTGQVTALLLHQNRLAGTIPPELGRLASLQTLSLGGNQLHGAIPPELGRLSSLLGLYAWQNRLSGEIPSTLGSLVNLRRLQLQDNHLHGEIPSELGRLANLEDLRLGGSNQFTGCIPAKLRAVGSNDLAGVGLPFC